MDTKNARRVQDPLSFRCLAPVMGAAFDQLARAAAAIEADLNGAGDSPVVLADDDEMLSTVNFDTTALALAFEGLGLALSHAAAIAVFRIVKLMSPCFTDLPRFLTRHGGSRTGFATVQKTASALEAEIRHLASPLGPMTAPVADGVEDYAPMTPRVSSRRPARSSRRLARLAAVELTVAAQAVDLRGNASGRRHAPRPCFRARARGRARRRSSDRADFEQIAQAIAAGELRAALTGAT